MAVTGVAAIVIRKIIIRGIVPAADIPDVRSVILLDSREENFKTEMPKTE